ncbi:MAG: Tetracycline resistance protein, class C [Firmicutes bacterium ADurb.Bin373]|nr:MAG: Tetracycline resistance protein, class C [Firmicutes bacterium ADurb.Bin373]
MKNHSREIIILFFSLFLVMVGFGIIIPILPFFVTRLNGNATALGFLMASYSLMQFFFAPFWGRLSDRIGRRPVLLIGLSGYGITFILFGLSTQLWMLFSARILSGIISSATLPTAMAYISDITASKDRAGGMGTMGAAMGLGMIFGPALGGWLGHYSFSLPFFVAGGLAILTLPFAWFFLTESLKEPGVSTQEGRRLSLEISKNPQFPLFIVAFVVSFSMAMFESTFALFAAARVGFGPREMGLLFTVIGVLSVIIQAGMIGRFVNRFGDAMVITAGIVISVIGFLLLMAAPNAAFIIVYAGIFTAGNSLLRPSISTLVTKTAREEEQGSAVGIMQSFDSLGRILGPVTGGIVFDFNINFPYLLGIMVLIAVLLFFKRHQANFSMESRA